MATVKRIDRWEASDGSVHKTREEAVRRENLVERVGKIMSRLEPRPEDDGIALENGTGWLQHNERVFWEVREALLEIAKEYTDLRWIQESIDDRTAHPSWAGRAIGECCPNPLSSAWYRISCTNTTSFREYGQPYFVDHEGEAKAPAK